MNFLIRLSIVGLFSLMAATHVVADDLDVPTGYGTKIAVVIGIDYASGAAKQPIPALKTAENDAKAVAEILRDTYGFDVTLALGSKGEATREKLETLLAKIKSMKRVEKGTNDADAPQNAAVLFFAGHGYRYLPDGREDAENNYKVLLYPSDIKFGADNKPDDDTCLALSRLTETLEMSGAHHRLLLLDNCHAGQVFRTRATGPDPMRFLQPSIQAITACSPKDEASDQYIGTGHSPFTFMMLDALKANASPQTQGSGLLTASLLGNQIEREMRLRQIKQTPQYGYVPHSNWRGDFYFIPVKRSIDHPAPGVVGLLATPAPLDLQTVPTLGGKWWFDEVPYLVPQVRAASTLAERAEITVTRGGGLTKTAPNFLFQPEAKTVHDALREQARKFAHSSNTGASERIRTVVRLLTERLPDESDLKRICKILADEAASVPTAEVYHLLAVVQHKLGELPEARKSYSQATDAYRADKSPQGSPRNPGLLALCWTDKARLESENNDFYQADEDLKKVEENLGDALPILLQLHWRIAQGDALVQLERWDLAEERFRQALQIVDANLRGVKHPLEAYVRERLAWFAIERWKISDAQRFFAEAYAIRSNQASFDPQSEMSAWHDLHGLAMCWRYSGENDKATDAYFKLYREIGNSDSKYRRSSPMLRREYDNRLINTAERLGDCYLFQGNIQSGRASRYYDEGMSYTRRLSPTERDRWLRKLLAKHALAKALAGELPESRALLAKSEAIKLQEKESPQVALYFEFTRLLNERPAKNDLPALATWRSTLNDFIVAKLQSQKRLDCMIRDTREVLLLAARTLVSADLDADGGGPAVTDHVDHMLDLLIDGPEEQVLRFLRPYFELAIDAELQGTHEDRCTRAQAWICKAVSGNSVFIQPPDRKSVAFFFKPKSGYVIISDLDGAKSQELTFGWKDLATPVALSSDKSLTDLKQALAAVRGPMDIHWNDVSLAPPLNEKLFPLPLPMDAKFYKATSN
jgi:tetratricopeptide (TPR) repeat protein